MTFLGPFRTLVWWCVLLSVDCRDSILCFYDLIILGTLCKGQRLCFCAGLSFLVSCLPCSSVLLQTV